MKIQVEPHTLKRARERGASLEEIQDVVENGFSVPSRAGRIARAMIYPFKQEGIGKYYEHKRVEVVYVEEMDMMVIITVYVFYGEWKA
jgi:predicted RND superfamily exporter protein